MSFHRQFLYLKISPEDPDSRLRDRMARHELYVEGPDPVVLCGREGPQRPVADPPRGRHLALLRQELDVVDPDARHLVHEHQRPLEAVVDGVVAGVGDDTVLHLLPADLKVVVPELVAARQLLQRPLEDEVEDVPGGVRLVLDVPDPRLEEDGVNESQEVVLTNGQWTKENRASHLNRVGIPENFFLVSQVLLVEDEVHGLGHRALALHYHPRLFCKDQEKMSFIS